MKDDLATEIEALLGDLRDCLLSGRIEQLEAIEAALSAALPRLAGRDPQTLQQLLALAEANRPLLQAATRGVRAARRRLAEIAAALDGLVTYDHAGQRQSAAPATRLHRRF